MLEHSKKETTLENDFQGEQVFVIASGHFVHDVYSAFLAPLLPLIRERLALSLTMAGFLTAAMQLPAILNPVVGHYADKFKPRYLVVWAPAITATLMSVIGLPTNYYILALTIFLAGISVVLFHAPAPAMVARSSGTRIGKGMGWFMAGGELGRTVGPIVAVWAASFWGLEGIYRVAGIGWLTSLVLFTRLKDGPSQKRSIGSLESVKPKLTTLILPLVFIIFFRMFLAVSMTTYLPTYMDIKGASLWMAGGFLAVMEFAGVAGALLSGAMSDRLGRKSILLWVTIISSPLMLAFIYAPQWMLIPILILLGFFSLSTGPIFLAIMQDHFPQNRSLGNGIYLTLSSLLRSLVMILVGVAGDAFGLQLAFIANALIALLAVPAILRLPADITGDLA